MRRQHSAIILRLQWCGAFFHFKEQANVAIECWPSQCSVGDHFGFDWLGDVGLGGGGR
jgi:hypothetical protein